MAVKVETVIEKYIKLREMRSDLKREYDSKDFELKDKMDKIEVHLLGKLQEQGVDSFKTSTGTAYTTERFKTSCDDWTTFWGWCAKTGRLDMLEKRISSGSVKEYKEETGALPPAVNVFIERAVNVRRPS